MERSGGGPWVAVRTKCEGGASEGVDSARAGINRPGICDAPGLNVSDLGGVAGCSSQRHTVMPVSPDVSGIFRCRSQPHRHSAVRQQQHLDREAAARAVPPAEVVAKTWASRYNAVRSPVFIGARQSIIDGGVFVKYSSARNSAVMPRDSVITPSQSSEPPEQWNGGYGDAAIADHVVVRGAVTFA